MIRRDASVPAHVFESLRGPIETGAAAWSGLGEAFVYGVGRQPEPREVVVRLSTHQAVVPLLFYTEHLDPGAVAIAVRGALTRADM